jgi:hypothetical protein
MPTFPTDWAIWVTLRGNIMTLHHAVIWLVEMWGGAAPALFSIMLPLGLMDDMIERNKK